MKRYLTILIAIVATAGSMAFAQTTTATATPAPAGKAATMKQRLQRRMIKALDLTDAQKQQAKTIRQNTRQQVEPLALQLKQDRQTLNAAVQAGDTTKIQQLSTQLGTLQGQALALRAGGRAQFFALLTPDQKTKAAEFQQKVKQVLGGKGD
jgi:protein CpxP